MRGRARWISGPFTDVALAWCWVPFATLGWAVRGDVDTLAYVLGGVFVLSFLHQPLTLPLVYGDPDQRRSRRALFTWSPVVFVAGVTFGLWLSLTLVAIVAGLWNAEHTLMQRYGITRIYGRKGGDNSGPIEKPMLLSWLVLALVWVAADSSTADSVYGLPFGEVNTDSIQVLADMQPWSAALLAPCVIAVAVLVGAWVRGEIVSARAGTANPAKYMYVAATAALFAWVLFVDPLSGLIGYVGAHSIEYFVIVNRSLGARYAEPAIRRRFLLGYLGAFAALFAALRVFGSEDNYTFVVLVLGGLHVFYDGFIWKLRTPRVARSLDVVQPVPANATA